MLIVKHGNGGNKVAHRGKHTWSNMWVLMPIVRWHIRGNTVQFSSFISSCHLAYHTGDKRHTCGVCGYSTDHKGNFKKHQLTHSGDKEYKCGDCGYSTTQRSRLKRHQMIHSVDDKRYSCDQCGYSTNYKHHLKTHQLTHSGDKEY